LKIFDAKTKVVNGESLLQLKSMVKLEEIEGKRLLLLLFFL